MADAYRLSVQAARQLTYQVAHAQHYAAAADDGFRCERDISDARFFDSGRVDAAGRRGSTSPQQLSARSDDNNSYGFCRLRFRWFALHFGFAWLIDIASIQQFAGSLRLSPPYGIHF